MTVTLSEPVAPGLHVSRGGDMTVTMRLVRGRTSPLGRAGPSHRTEQEFLRARSDPRPSEGRAANAAEGR